MTDWILVLADDLTGALETGAKFSDWSLPARVTTELSISAPPDSPVLVVDTETRHLQPIEASDVVRRVITQISDRPPTLIYKKTDSTLRGNIAAEFLALRQVIPNRPLVYVPAYPELGRTVRNGHLFVWDTPVHRTAFAHDRLNPVRESDIRSLLGDTPATILDGQCNADIQAAAHMILQGEPPRLAAGPAALAEALAECLSPAGKTSSATPVLSRCLVVNGSRHPASVAQIEIARDCGCFHDGWHCFEQTPGGEGLHRAKDTGDRVRRFLQSSRFDALVVFGGDTAFGIHQSLGATPFISRGEIAPGVPLSRGGELFWITKAGGFGDPNILSDLKRLLT